jgi:serine/threonine-protein kinase HipA
MARRAACVPLNVFLNGRPVGVLRREATGAVDFQYAKEWLDFRGTFPVSLSLPLFADCRRQR